MRLAQSHVRRCHGPRSPSHRHAVQSRVRLCARKAVATEKEIENGEGARQVGGSCKHAVVPLSYSATQIVFNHAAEEHQGEDVPIVRRAPQRRALLQQLRVTIQRTRGPPKCKVRRRAPLSFQRCRRCPLSMKVSKHLSRQSNIAVFIASQPSMKRSFLSVKVEGKFQTKTSTNISHLCSHAHTEILYCVFARACGDLYVLMCVCAWEQVSVSLLFANKSVSGYDSMCLRPLLPRSFHASIRTDDLP